jgi:hypothetical protein
VTATQIIELVVALALIVGGVVVYRRGGTQGGVILMVIGLIVAVHGSGLLQYRPSQAEIDMQSVPRSPGP